MELDVTRFVENECVDYTSYRFTDSVANSGLSNIGEITWNNAKQHVENSEDLVLTPEQVEAVREHFLGYGAWEEDELQDPAELTAMVFQEVSAEYQEHYEELEDGEEPDFSCSGGRLVRGDDNTWLYYVGT